jgi:hypothetical protein
MSAPDPKVVVSQRGTSLQLSLHYLATDDTAVAGVEQPSWKKMYLTQPPCDISIVDSYGNPGKCFKAATFGELLEIIADHMAGKHQVKEGGLYQLEIPAWE